MLQASVLEIKTVSLRDSDKNIAVYGVVKVRYAGYDNCRTLCTSVIYGKNIANRYGNELMRLLRSEKIINSQSPVLRSDICADRGISLHETFHRINSILQFDTEFEVDSNRNKGCLISDEMWVLFAKRTSKGTEYYRDPHLTDFFARDPHTIQRKDKIVTLNGFRYKSIMTYEPTDMYKPTAELIQSEHSKNLFFIRTTDILNGKEQVFESGDAVIDFVNVVSKVREYEFAGYNVRILIDESLYLKKADTFPEIRRVIN